MAKREELLRQVRARERAASQKVYRNERKGVRVAHTEFDPRRWGEDISRLNSRQLRSYMNKLDRFVDRKTQFEAGYKGAPLPREMVRRYQRAESARNLRGRQHAESLRDVYIAPTGMTVGQREDTIVASNLSILRAGGNPQYRPYDEVRRSISGIPDAGKLAKLTKIAERQAKTDFVRRGLIAQRRNHVAFLENNGATEQADEIRNLTLRQFDILMNQTDYQNKNRYRYLTADKSGDDRLDRITDDAQQEIGELLDWAKAL